MDAGLFVYALYLAAICGLMAIGFHCCGRASDWAMPVLVVFTGVVGLYAGAPFGIVIDVVAFLPVHDKQNFAVRSLIVTLASVQTLLYFSGRSRRACPACSAPGG